MSTRCVWSTAAAKPPCGLADRWAVKSTYRSLQPRTTSTCPPRARSRCRATTHATPCRAVPHQPATRVPLKRWSPRRATPAPRLNGDRYASPCAARRGALVDRSVQTDFLRRGVLRTDWRTDLHLDAVRALRAVGTNVSAELV